MNTARRARALFALAWLIMLAPARSAAHDLDIAQLELRELSAGQFVFRWTHGDPARAARQLTPRWPEACSSRGQSLTCAGRGLVGPLSIDGVGRTHSLVLVRVEYRDGAAQSFALTTAEPSAMLDGGAADTPGWRDLARSYLALGVEHIFSGVDHLAFVASLLLLVGFQGQLLLTITAFTLAHSLTLAASVLGWLAPRPAPVEVCIALSIVLVASEAARGQATLTRRLPALVALLFGLVHGAGFAGALREAGLPAQNLSLALFAFNAGVEIGQLLAVLLAYALWRALAQLRWRGALRAPALYVLGSAAVYWSLQRMLDLAAP